MTWTLGSAARIDPHKSHGKRNGTPAVGSIGNSYTLNHNKNLDALLFILDSDSRPVSNRMSTHGRDPEKLESWNS